jgi:hypothetical protein
MGGFGSERPSGSGRVKVESCRSLDVNRLHREGCLRAGWIGGWQWTVDGKEVASIGLRAECHRLELTYRIRIGDRDWEAVAETVRLVRVACRYGGTRPYFVCPGVVNGRAYGRPVAKLHLGGRYFLCRHCYRLDYASQSEASFDRALRRANKIRQRLGGDPGMVAPFPSRPKGMWQRTYEVYAGAALRLRSGPAKQWPFGPSACIIGSTRPTAKVQTAKGASGNERDELDCSSEE